MTANLELFPAAPGKRLGAAVLHCLPLVVLVMMFAIRVTRTRSVKAGRNPLTAGGIRGPYSFAPLGVPALQHVSSPVTVANSIPQVINAQAALNPIQWQPPGSAQPGNTQPGIPHSGAAQPAATPSPAAAHLIGRNPNGQPGEQHAQLLAVVDPGRSISKTQLHLPTDGAGVWVADRNSATGSAVTTPDGVRTPLQAGVPAFVSPGSTVHFGDRTFHLGQA